jgi:hypothetical protein
LPNAKPLENCGIVYQGICELRLSFILEGDNEKLRQRGIEDTSACFNAKHFQNAFLQRWVF